MFDIDKWQEIFATLRKNKLRTFLTSFSVAWGILLLIILLGAGNGLQNAVMKNFERSAKNAVWIHGGQTSLEHKGMPKDRNIQLVNNDYEVIQEQVGGIDHISPQFNIWYGTTITYKNELGNFSVQCVLPDHQPIEGSHILKGRYLNEIDVRHHRKVCVIGVEMQKALFKEIDPIGEYIKINNILFRVVGVFTDNDRYQDSRLVVPFSSAQMIFNGGLNVSTIGLTTGDATVEESKLIEDDLRKKLAALHGFSPEDRTAVNIYNTLDDYEQTQTIFGGIRMFIWIIGIGTLIAGVVGVSNIMLIVVKDRTREIGVRKALGATPYSVVSLIISEAVFITTVAGYIGMVMGVMVMELVDMLVDKSIEAAAQNADAGGSMVIFLNPNADMQIAIGATLLLIISGAIAGMIPAVRASRIKPIEALRYE